MKSILLFTGNQSHHYHLTRTIYLFFVILNKFLDYDWHLMKSLFEVDIIDWTAGTAAVSPDKGFAS
jgi:hypothetical protein